MIRLPMRTQAARTPSSHARGRWRSLLPVIAVVLSLIAGFTVWLVTRDDSAELAGEAVVTVSSTESGSSARYAVDSGSASAPGAGWRSNGDNVGAWIELSWPKAHLLRRVVLVRNLIDQPGVTDGFLAFGDGTFLQVALSRTSRETVVAFSPRSVQHLRFTASKVSPGAKNVEIAEILVSSSTSDDDDVVIDDIPGGNVAPSARATQSGGASDPRTLQDGSTAPGANTAGADWTTDRPAGAWVQLDWDRPREISGVEVVGSARSTAELTSATLAFGDGATLPVGAVLTNPDRPTIVSFMPRVTRSLRLSIDHVDKVGPLVLGELRAFQRGVTPPHPRSRAAPSPALEPAGPCPPSAGAGSVDGLVVLCPLTGSVVDRAVTVRVAAQTGYSAVTGTVWPADESAPVGSPVRATPDPSGVAELTLDLGGVPPGPFTVQFEATGEGREARTVYFQLHRSGAAGGAPVPSSGAAAGRTLAFDEEFDGPISVSRDGLGADYAAAKPVYNGAQDFGDAIFPNSELGFDNVRVVDNDYLRIDVAPSPPGYADPARWGRTHIGGLLASARQGGSGFSAQYGYFEARMLAPAAPGTWPAFWTLPSDNLIAPVPVEAEFDAVELYGHDPKKACQSTHAHRGEKDDYLVQCGERFATERAALAWHTYGVEVMPTGVTFYVDGRVVATARQVEGGDAPMFFLVNLALGGGWPVKLAAVQDRAALYVDYVRVYV